ncbi:MAG: glycoside hydrolase family 31 protein [Acidimicrobiia bacterium]|nr:glycoside hydrolase family 31 protein [Acidimicrobiia bacterium]
MSLYDTHPQEDRLDTRRLESRQVVRACVARAEVADLGPGWVELRTVAPATRIQSGEVTAADLPDEGQELVGRYRIDLVGSGGVRLRYCEGDAVPDGDTPMLVDVPPATVAGDAEEVDGIVRLVGEQVTVVVTLAPFSVLIADATGEEIVLVGGPEKNRWGLWDTSPTGVHRVTDSGRPVATETFGLRPGECIYGFGEQFLGLDKVGQTIDVNMEEATGTTTPRSYKNVPVFVSTHGYGVLANHSCRMTAWVGSRVAADVQVALEDAHYDLFVLVGDIATVLDRLTELTGRPGLPPRWSFGFWQSKISYRSAEETRSLVRRLRAERLPLDVLHLDTHWYDRDWFCNLEFSTERFPDPAGYLAEMADLGVHVCLWQLPYIPEPSALFDDLAAVNGFVQQPDGSIYDVGLCYSPGWEGGRVGCIDFTNPDAVAVYQRHLRRLFDLGAAAIKADFGEQAPLDGVYHDGTPGHRMHNLYPLLYNRAVWEATEAATGEPVIWARSAWAGSQRYPLHWGGDSTADWSNLGPQLCGGLSFGLSGFPFWSQDIGGFLGRPDGEMLIRWLQVGLFGSHARIHGESDRELDTWGPDIADIARDLLDLRYRLLPTIWAAARRAVDRSLPMLRPLVVDHQDDPSTWRIADQWTFADALLVAPVLDPSGRRRVYLPAGTWADWWTGELIDTDDGGRWITVEAPLERIPLYQRAGTVVALGPTMQFVDERPIDELEVRLVPPRAGQALEATSFEVDDERSHDVRVTPEDGTPSSAVVDTGDGPVGQVTARVASPSGWSDPLEVQGTLRW